MDISQVRIPKITPSQLFFTLCILISAATFRHSTIGFASLEGSMFWGALSALAVDVLMFLFAHTIRRDGFSWKLAFGLSIPALASVYTQLLFAVTEAQVLAVAPGAAWMGDLATDVTNMRVVALPALLPVLMLVAALMGKHEDAQTVAAEVHATTVVQLETIREQAADMRLGAQANTAELEQLRQANTAHERRLEILRAPETTKTATAMAQALLTHVYTNGNRPATKVIAGMLNVSDQTVRKASADIQERMPGINGEQERF